ncbi:MAG: DEAD/DEAH box helicase [Candidatus Moranbacteria bacterium]|nr:DEAD/DEAH box helicase [Candidatus Moranbacteria bacterium]
MHSRNFKAGSSRPPRSRAPFQGGRKNPFNNGGGSGRKKRFTGNYIDVSRFINKAVPQVAEEKYVPDTIFADFKIEESIKKNIAARGFEHPTPIQDKTIPHILAGKDLIGLANTGTGKTGAFLLPMLDKIIKNPNEKLLVVVPTRELAIQIQEEFRAFAAGLRIGSVVVVGGANIRTQIECLRSRYNVVIGTPGRLKDLIQRKNLHLNSFANVVLDEADRMLDMGFMPDVRYLLSLIAPKRQTLFFSATLAPEIEKLIQEFLNDPVKISIKTRETSSNIDQDVVRVKPGEDKIEVLQDLLRKANFSKVLIFSRTKHGAEKLSVILSKNGFKAQSIHGDKSHAKRQKALKLFKENYVEILVATDVAARGLDIPDVSHVINFDVPATYDDYVHRIGRTGRAGKTGTALTFV